VYDPALSTNKIYINVLRILKIYLFITIHYRYKMNIVLITLHYNSNVKSISGLVTIFKPFSRLVTLLKVWKNTCVTNVYIFNHI